MSTTSLRLVSLGSRLAALVRRLTSIAGGSAAAAGSLVRKLGGDLLGYVFMMELDFLKGRDKLDAPVHTLLSGQEEGLEAQREELPLGQTKETKEEQKPVQDAGGAAAETRP